jgi:hypothetical protein
VVINEEGKLIFKILAKFIIQINYFFIYSSRDSRELLQYRDLDAPEDA